MPPKRPLTEASAPQQCLEFDTWRAQRADGRHTERALNSAYDPSLEELPDKLWYTLNHRDIDTQVSNMCQKLLRPVRKLASVNQETKDLVDALGAAKETPTPAKINIAVVGDQGIGKSSLINALLHRDLVNVSASSSACTAFATIIQHKRGAPDNTTKSDIEVEFLNEDEIREFVEEQIRRYTDVYDSTVTDTQSAGDDSLASDDTSDNEYSLSTARPDGKRKISETLQRGADTAKEFFHAIFKAEENEGALQDLQAWLEDADLGDGRFLERCIQISMNYLTRYHGVDGSRVHVDVSDEDLAQRTELAATIWPLVKSVTISTGSILLRNGICFLDLPGYGDLNQMRRAVVNDYRRKANFEMVVAKSDRYLSSTVQNHYLTRAIREHETKNTILVLNKADSFLTTGASEVQKLISNIREEPFFSLKARLATSATLTEEDPALVQAYRKDMIKEAQLAYISREAGQVRAKMLEKGVEVFSVSAGQYMIWKDRARFENPPIEPEVSGIPFLRRYLLALPAESNWKELTDHIFEVLPDIDDQVGRILEKFDDDDAYTAVRAHLSQRTPELIKFLKELSIGKPHSLVPKLWTHEERQKIAENLRSMVESWGSPKVHYSSFMKMLRENGIPLSGKAKGRNMNDEILKKYKHQLKRWNKLASTRTEELGLLFDEPVQAFLHDIQHRFDQTPADPDLKRRANEALKKTTRRIGIAQGKLMATLISSVKATYLHFATESDIRCPVARQMKATYIRVAYMDVGKKKVGDYKREELARCITQTTRMEDSVLDAMQIQIMGQQTKFWQSNCETFASEVLQLLQDFAIVTQNLVARDDQESDEHEQVRRKLSRYLPEFQRALLEVQTQFPGTGTEAQRAIKRAKLTPNLPTRLSTLQNRREGQRTAAVKHEE